MKIVFVRKQDYWIFPLSGFGVFFVGAFLYIGEPQLKLISGLLGLSTLHFMTYLIRKNYNRQLAARYLLICLISAILLAYFFYSITS